MHGKFLIGQDLEIETLEWGDRKWFSLPSLSSAQHIVVVHVNLQPGFGHNFHLHPNQEELVYVINGEIEQWLETEKQILKSGDAAFIPANTIHASFNISDEPVNVLAILSPSIGEEGYEVVEVGDQAPWNTLR
jgi:quercetin dioxygenase-like cupin family protein